jgi:hypothetical protein
MQNRIVAGRGGYQLIAMPPAVARSVPGVIRARALELVDGRGRSRASIDVRLKATLSSGSAMRPAPAGSR